jgi:hypothetical protein
MSLAEITVPRTRLPDGLELHEELGKGSNNKVFAATLDDRPCVLRVPRRRSDTQQRGSALWEYTHMKLASDLRVGPEVHAAWFARHATREWPSGLYVVMERLEHDLETVLCEDRDLMPLAMRRRAAIEAELVRCVSTLARAHLFVYDLKPSNVVITLSDDDDVAVQARIIDYGRDFCEIDARESSDPTRSSPHIDMLRRCVEADGVVGEDADARISHILFVVMMIVLSATTTRCIYEDRGHHRHGRAERAELHPLRDVVSRLLDGIRARDMTLVRKLMRMDDVRGVLRHYHGRRNSGTERTIRFARGIEHGS